jgi:hypothetical protein
MPKVKRGEPVGRKADHHRYRPGARATVEADAKRAAANLPVSATPLYHPRIACGAQPWWI